ncbi:MAG: PD40 domain-containing protein [Anaerolineae bacterium]|nr:PD40 domain-containing protein [Anaerolineae bacterium]
MPNQNDTFIVNPYVAGSPVKDSAMFFGRDDVYAWIRQHLRGEYQDNAIVLYGERRAGKTSVLYHMAERLGDNTYVPVLLDLQGMGLEGMDGFLWELARRIVLSLRRVEGMPELNRPNRRDFEGHPRSHFEDVFLPPVIEVLRPRRLLLMFDETNRLEERVHAGMLPPDVFDYLRALIQERTQLNFLFSLGSRVEESGISSQLFNLAVYRKISFLERDFAEDLITGPVAKYYTYTPAAIERIYRLTSGQPYYTQLLCHNLFTRWSDQKPAQLNAADVEAVLVDVVEQAIPNLQFVWDDSPPIEKAVLAALADQIPHYRAGVMRRNLDRALHRVKLHPPNGDVTTALKRLFERDIINNQEPYEFRVGLMQQWLSEFKQLDWVREELGDVVEEWERLEQQRLAETPTPLERARRWVAPVLAVLLVGVLIITFILYQNFQETRQQSYEAETRVAQLAAEIAANSTRAAESQAALIAASTQVAEAEAKGNSAEVANARATASAVAATAQALDAAAATVKAQEATAVAEATQSAAEAGLLSGANTPTPPPPTDTPLPPPPTHTPLPPPSATATPIPSPTATPLPALADSLKGTIAYPAFNGTTYDIYFGNIADGTSRLYRAEASQPAFDNTGMRIAFNSWARATRGLVTANRNGGNEVIISNFVEDKLPTWSPDGNTILFLSRRTGSRASQLYRTSANIDFQFSDSRYIVEGEYPTWGVSSNVVFRGWGTTGSGLRLTPADFGNSETLTTSNLDTAPALSPDGQRIAFMSLQEGNWDIYVINADGSNRRRLTTNPARDGLPTWSPDGRAIAFATDRDGEWTIWAASVVNNEQQKLLTMAGSPDGTVLYDQNNSTGWLEERLSWAPQ